MNFRRFYLGHIYEVAERHSAARTDCRSYEINGMGCTSEYRNGQSAWLHLLGDVVQVVRPFLFMGTYVASEQTSRPPRAKPVDTFRGTSVA